MKEESGMTQAQKDARAKAWSIVLEHFDAAVLIVEADSKDGMKDVFDCEYHSGLSRAVGLCERAKNWLVNETQEEDE